MLDQRRSEFGTLSNGESVDQYQLENECLELSVSNYGCRLVSLRYKALNQQLVMGQWSLSEYQEDTSYSGAVVGRTCNRINEAHFELEGVRYALDANEASHHLHGGSHGFHNRCWTAQTMADGIVFETTSDHGEGGYPGFVKASVKLSLQGSRLIYDYRASADRLTYVDMTNHTYFCLDNSGSILDHQLRISSHQYIPVNQSQIPTGEILPCQDTPFDFSRRKPVGQDIHDDHPQLAIGRGYDHSYLLDSTKDIVAELYSPLSHILMKVESDAPAVQLYTGNHLNAVHSSLCLETQHLPNACNQQGFLKSLVKPGSPFESRTVFDFSVSH
jgi:aldose 1-epimerase